MKYSRSIHVRLSDEDNITTMAAAEKFYRGNRTDLVRDAIIQHLARLYAGDTTPSPRPSRVAPNLDTNNHEV